jgi:cysteine desulfurase
MRSEYANPSSLYQMARITRTAVESARHKVSTVLGSKLTEVVFTSGGTEGNNLAIQGVLRAHAGANWVTTAIEHDAVLSCAEPMRREGHLCSVIPVKPNGIVDPATTMAAVTDNTALISVMMANNEIGTVQPVADIARLVVAVRDDRRRRGIDLPIYLHTDAVQAAGYLDLHVARLGVDLLTISGSKIYGPKGTGCVYIRQGTVLQPLQYGGGQERDRRSGTENVAGIVGLAEALQLCGASRDAETHRLIPLRQELVRALTSAIAGVIVNGDTRRRLPNNVNITIPGAEGEALVLYLDRSGIMASTGSACSTGDLDPSHVLRALGRTPQEAANSLRFTLGRSTTPEAVDRVGAVLPDIATRLRELG